MPFAVLDLDTNLDANLDLDRRLGVRKVPYLGILLSCLLERIG